MNLAGVDFSLLDARPSSEAGLGGILLDEQRKQGLLPSTIGPMGHGV